MRFVPLIPSSFNPAGWVPMGPVALDWTGDLHGDWAAAVRRGAAVHGVHLPDAAPLEAALDALRQGLEPDFLVLPVARPGGREAGFRLLGQLESLLEATSGRGPKLALRLEAGAEAEVVDLLKQARAEAVGFCWHPATEDAEVLADRLWCGLCGADSDLRPLQRLGYRWDMALPAGDPETFRAQAADLAARHPEVIFPAEMPATALGRPVVPDPEVVLGHHLRTAGNGEGRP
jgi:hypothetical protein